MTGWQIFGTALALTVAVGMLATVFIFMARDLGLKEAVVANAIVYGVVGLLVFGALLSGGVIAP